MSYETILTVVLIFACFIQFYLTFIKGRSNVKEFGNEIFRLKVNAFKFGLLGLLFVFIMFYLFYSLIKSNASILGLLIVIYVLFAILDFSKIKIITDKGFGQKSIYYKGLYNFYSWENIESYQWHDKRKTMLMFKINKEGKLITNDWEVSIMDLEEVNKLFNEHVKTKIEVQEIKTLD